ncbi:hypothetical protein PP175_28225 (plasmid) [Aneurinibacillus sp. Ricciae_BoGa-3]|uniref:hypothetical protein n=1 Tax=Aneurinibacillus sp. Ricciae_BoGa-3 TaxID=3022697 RepID=UPI00234129B8|nr:hypothetical protein [Aneurinibacillus sp. Ricciae_BoGa-3]WCK57078.1 hypothetical protein PP175_28225 [Aneurinibacillus sp. Ricciae_BoGa-3]
MDFKDNSRASRMIENMKNLIVLIEESMVTTEDTSHLVNKLANQANELKKLAHK